MADHGIWMPMYWADYFKDTLDFSNFQHACYLLLIGAYWERGGPLPDDMAALARICRTTKDKLGRSGNPVLGKFIRSEGLLRHERIDSEILRSCERISASKAAAHARWMRKDMLITTTITKERKSRARARPENGAALALSPDLTPERIEELKDKTDRIMRRGKYTETFS